MNFVIELFRFYHHWFLSINADNFVIKLSPFIHLICFYQLEVVAHHLNFMIALGRFYWFNRKLQPLEFCDRTWFCRFYHSSFLSIITDNIVIELFRFYQFNHTLPSIRADHIVIEQIVAPPKFFDRTLLVLSNSSSTWIFVL